MTLQTQLPTQQKIRAIESKSRNRINSTKHVKTILFILATVVALCFTALTSFSLIYNITLHRGPRLAAAAAIFGLLLIDGMLLYWTLIAFRNADSTAQRITAGIMASVTVLAIGVIGIGEQMLADGFVDDLQMRYIVTGFVVSQIVGVAVYELTSYDARLSMATYKSYMQTVQTLDNAKIEEAESFADVILAEAQLRANHAHAIANQVRSLPTLPDEAGQAAPGANGRGTAPKVTHTPQQERN